MAEYYPLLAKAVASLPNSTPDSRKIVYERARKALIGQLRTLHPPVPDADIEAESVALDRAIDRLERELAAPPPAPDAGLEAGESEPLPLAASASPVGPAAAPEPKAAQFPPTGGALGPTAAKPFAPLRTKLPPPKHPLKPVSTPTANGVAPPAAGSAPVSSTPVSSTLVSSSSTSLYSAPIAASEAVPASAGLDAAAPTAGSSVADATPPGTPLAAALASVAARPEAAGSPLANGLAASQGTKAAPVRTRAGGEAAVRRLEPQRPFAPQPPEPQRPKRRLWIIPVGVGLVMLLVGLAAYQLRDRPEILARSKVVEPQAGSDTSKIVERVGGPGQATGTPAPAAETPAANPGQQQALQQPAPNPAAPVAGRAALLVEAPDEPNKVKTYLGTVVWRLDNVSGGQNQAVGLAVRADIDLPDDKLKASVIFQKNVDASLPASHTFKIRFAVQPSSPTGNVKEIGVPQMRREDSPTGEALDGVTVPIVENSFLIGLSPGNSEAANLELLRARDWIDVQMILSNTRIAKLTFEKTDVGQRDIQEAITAWAKP